jgi:hypothetical protein
MAYSALCFDISVNILGLLVLEKNGPIQKTKCILAYRNYTRIIRFQLYEPCVVIPYPEILRNEVQFRVRWLDEENQLRASLLVAVFSILQIIN